MGYSPLVIKRILAYVPRGKKRYTCALCHKQFSFVDMRLHLEIDHEKKVEGAAYAYYEAEALSSNG